MARKGDERLLSTLQTSTFRRCFTRMSKSVQSKQSRMQISLQSRKSETRKLGFLLLRIDIPGVLVQRFLQRSKPLQVSRSATASLSPTHHSIRERSLCGHLQPLSTARTSPTPDAYIASRGSSWSTMSNAQFGPPTRLFGENEGFECQLWVEIDARELQVYKQNMAVDGVLEAWIPSEEGRVGFRVLQVAEMRCSFMRLDSSTKYTST